MLMMRRYFSASYINSKSSVIIYHASNTTNVLRDTLPDTNSCRHNVSLVFKIDTEHYSRYISAKLLNLPKKIRLCSYRAKAILFLFKYLNFHSFDRGSFDSSVGRAEDCRVHSCYP